jgi:excisionase family DNA binding protein
VWEERIGMADTVTVAEAAARLGVSRQKVWALVKEGVLEARQNPLDKRQKLIPVAALHRLEPGGNRRRFRSDGSGANLNVQSVDIEEYLRERWRPC